MPRQSHPKPWRLVQCSTRFVRVPIRYWTEVLYGGRREFRFLGRSATLPYTLKPPSLVVAWSESGGEYRSSLMVCTHLWVERLGEISNDSLEAEGHVGPHAMQSFRTEWSERTHRRFRYDQKVWVIRLRPVERAEFTKLAFVQLARMYEEHLTDDVRASADLRSEELLAGS